MANKKLDDAQMDALKDMLLDEKTPEDVAAQFNIAVSSVHNYRAQLKKQGITFPNVRGRRPSHAYSTVTGEHQGHGVEEHDADQGMRPRPILMQTLPPSRAKVSINNTDDVSATAPIIFMLGGVSVSVHGSATQVSVNHNQVVVTF